MLVDLNPRMTFIYVEEMGRVMLCLAKQGYPKRVLETSDITAIGATLPRSTV
jgi:hypothetical protein